MRGFGRLGFTALALVGGIGTIGCQARTDEFYRRVYKCESNVSDTCGTTRTGGAMTCFAASQLGGEDFCTEACDGTQPSPDPGFVCTTSGALLKKCTPPSGDAGASDDCPEGLSCYRTDLVFAEGVCIQMSVCSQDTDCSENMHVCAATLIKQRSSLFADVNNLQCVASGCGSGRSQCPPGQLCLASYYEGANDPAYDICVPACDGRLNCPPNFACALSAQSVGSPPICLPGVPGIRCQHDQDCVVGDCVDTGANFKECVPTFLACRTDGDCAGLDGVSATFLCVEGVPGAGKHCILTEEFDGTNCEVGTDCPGGFICTHVSPFAPTMTHGECRVPCTPDLDCQPRGGIPHICLAGGTGGCYPTSFGLPCGSAGDCVPELDCLSVLPDEHTVIDSPMICTRTCTTDDECIGNPLIRGGSFCRQDEHLCRMAGFPGAPCQADDECIVKPCTIDASGTGTCAG
jgi:hypothetical protein